MGFDPNDAFRRPDNSLILCRNRLYPRQCRKRSDDQRQRNRFGR